MSEEQYLEYDRTHDGRHEYVNGEVVAMAGGSEAHALLVLNVGSALRSAFGPRGCRTYGSDLRVLVPDTRLYTYPDATVVCGPSQHAARGGPALTNPVLLAEVLSPSTEHHDRGAKFAHYRRLASLQAYLLVSSTERHVELFTLRPEGWTLTEARGSAVLELPSLGVHLPLDEVYRDFEAVLSAQAE